MTILVLNCGSSSAKFAVIDPASEQELLTGLAQRLGSPHATLEWKCLGERSSRPLPGATHEQALRAVIGLLDERSLLGGLRGVGHRVVHGGRHFSASTPVTAEVERAIEACSALGPLHNPPNLLGIRLMKELVPGVGQVAVFDTAFHQTMPPRAFTYPVPLAWLEQHDIRRYGFHGTSHRFVSMRALEHLGLTRGPSRLITAHLGNGCSLAAVKDGRSIDTTMGLTPLDGVMMGTRAGSIDPAIVCHMTQALNLPASRIGEILNKESGLLGVSGLSNDMRTIEEAAGRGHERARFALELFCYLLAKSVASLVVPLEGLDALVFTGGIGENSALVRARVIALLGFLGLTIDEEANAAGGRATGTRVSREQSPRAMVVPTNEELMIALDTAALVGSQRLRASA
jgi:acetate kinase